MNKPSSVQQATQEAEVDEGWSKVEAATDWPATGREVAAEVGGGGEGEELERENGKFNFKIII